MSFLTKENLVDPMEGSRHCQQHRFERTKPRALRSDIRVISATCCSKEEAGNDNVVDTHESNVAATFSSFTSAFLNAMIETDNHIDQLTSLRQVFEKMQDDLSPNRIPTITTSNPIRIQDEQFQLIPQSVTGIRRALLIGIHYNDDEGEDEHPTTKSTANDGYHHKQVLKMADYLQHVHGFEKDNITILMNTENDESDTVGTTYQSPTVDNIIQAYQRLADVSLPGDAILCHYVGRCKKVQDDLGNDQNESERSTVETLVPMDHQENGMIRDDDIYDILIQPLQQRVYCLFVMDCYPSGSVLNLPYRFVTNGNIDGALQFDENYDLKRLFGKFQQVYKDDEDDDEDDEDCDDFNDDDSDEDKKEED